MTKKSKKIVDSKGWTSVNIPVEYADMIIDVINKTKFYGSIAEFVRDAIRQRLVDMAKQDVPAYTTPFEHYNPTAVKKREDTELVVKK